MPATGTGAHGNSPPLATQETLGLWLFPAISLLNHGGAGEGWRTPSNTKVEGLG